MKFNKRSILAVTISMLLAACGSDDSGNSGAPVKPQPLVPEAAKQINLNIGGAAVTAMQESLVITTLEGEEKLTSVESFKGIKFAEAERFEHSNIEQLTGEIDATAFGDVCPQNKTTDLNLAQSEDCLNLNIWRPAGTTAGEDLPVYVFIHGGDFEYGSGANPMIHGDTVVAQGADEGNRFIAVTFNYRLGLLGSRFKKGTEGVDSEGNFNDGNYGIGDQKSLLEWVQNNISDFGGDTSKVTLMGQGSGAMSIEMLQHKMSLGQMDEGLFSRAIMQSASLGFEFPSYNAAKSRYDLMELNSLPSEKNDENNQTLAQITERQAELTDPITKVGTWLLRSAGGLVTETASEDGEAEVAYNLDLDIPLDLIGKVTDLVKYATNADNSPMAEFMPFAPYIECYDINDGFLGNNECKENSEVSQPAVSPFVVPTVVGVNSGESNTVAMLPSLTFLIPTILENLPESEQSISDESSADDLLKVILPLFADETSKQQMRNELAEKLDLDLSAQQESGALELNLTAYNAVTQLFLGLGNMDKNSELLNLADYYAKDESDIDGALANMGQFKTLLNDMLFTGPARMKVAGQSRDSVNYSNTFYYFDYKAAFNVWSYGTDTNGTTDYGDLLKSVSCVLSACKASELPFVFNKAVKMDGTELHPGSSDKQMMNEMSRVWFTDTLFNDYQYIGEDDDSVLVIDKNGINLSQPSWDRTTNEGVDPALRDGRLTGLESLGLIGHYL